MLLSRRASCTSAHSSRQQIQPHLHGLRAAHQHRVGVSFKCRAQQPRAGDDDLLLAQGCPVPTEQQPMNELKQLQEMFLFDWATVPVQDFAQKLASVWLGFYVLLGLPVSAFTFDVHKELLQCLAAASAGSTFIVTVLVWRLYLGWQHVGDRLISATVEYEETGWYDGQCWVKTPQMLMRDRLLSNYTVKPALARLKRTLLGLGGALAASMLLLAVVPPPPVSSASYYYGSSYAAAGSSYSSSGSSSYDETMAKYEPWAAQELSEKQSEEGSAGADDVDDGNVLEGRFDMRTHMMMAQQ